MRVDSSGGVTVNASGDVSGQTVQIGVINALGLGQAVLQLTNAPSSGSPQPTQPPPPTGSGSTAISTNVPPTFYQAPDTAGVVGRTVPLPNPPILDPSSTSPLDVILQGSARVDVFEVDGGLFSNIVDQTPGDIVNVIAASVGNLTSNGMIGLGQGHTGADLNGFAVVANTFPLLDRHNAITLGTAAPGAGGAGPTTA